MCKSLDIVIPGGHYLITRDEVRALVDKADSTVLWHPINYAGLRNLEKAILKSPYVEDVSVYAGVNGVLKVEVSQRQPLVRSEEHTSELQSLMSNSYAVFCLKK